LSRNFGVEIERKEEVMRIIVTACAILVAAALGCFATVPARAQDGSTSNDSAAADVGSPATASTNHVLQSTLMDQGDIGGGILSHAGAWIFGNVSSFTCTAPCTVEVEEMAQLGGNVAAQNTWSVCPIVDGSSLKFSCPFQGVLPISNAKNGGFVTGNFDWFVNLAKGPHTAQAGVTVAAAAKIFIYHITYRAYQP
jgi:hypothetical protein